MVPEPEHLDSIADQTIISLYILLRVDGMPAATPFDAQSGFDGNKIHYMTFDGLLSSKFTP